VYRVVECAEMHVVFGDLYGVGSDAGGGGMRLRRRSRRGEWKRYRLVSRT